MPKKPKLKTLKAKAWSLFSTYIRLRDSDENGTVECVTCGKLSFWKGDGMQAGHFVDSRINSVLFDERGVHSQCYACNCMLHGNKLKYYRFMQAKYGESIITELMALKNQSVKYTVGDYLDLIEDLKVKVKELSDGKNLPI